MRTLLPPVLLSVSLSTWLAAQEKPVNPAPAELDEKAFAALHDLKTEAPPKPTGTMVQIGAAEHYLALPKGKQAPLPAVVVIHEWWGLNDHVKHWADRLTEQGYAALAVDLYGGVSAKTPAQAQEAMNKVDAAQARATLLAAFDFLGTDERVRATRRASIGWCFGGKWSLQLAIAQPKLDACVLYYGQLPDDAAQLAKIEAPVLAVFGTKDASIPEARVAAFEASMRKLKKDVKVLRYEAAHAFANPSGARYDAKNAAAAWTEVKAFLRAKLVPVPAQPPAAKPGDGK
jgi:carboxymethylenebutenolidase